MGYLELGDHPPLNHLPSREGKRVVVGQIVFAGNCGALHKKLTKIVGGVFSAVEVGGRNLLIFSL
jgi:hypothetical protein